MQELITLLRQDEILKGLLGATATDPKIYMYDTTGYKNCIVYEFETVADDGVKEVDRLTIKAIANDFNVSRAIMKRIKDIIILIGDNKLTNNILGCKQNGGGSLKNMVDGVNWFYQIAYFEILLKK